jgi:CubicO group peptidase (beta-lactamase class C family)
LKHKKQILKVLKWVAIIFITVAIVFLGLLAVNTDFSSADNLGTFIENKIKKAGIAGISVAMIRDGEIASTWQAGFADIENHIPVETDTIFQTASISKTATGISVMQLYERGLLDLDDEINQYLSFKIIHPHYPETPITFRKLLSHTAGLKDNSDVIFGFYTIATGGGDSDVSLEEFVQGYFVDGGQWYNSQKNFTESAPGEDFLYSNAGYALLGYLVEEISGSSFPDYCKTNIFIPLEMDHTTWLLKDTNTNKMAIPYERSDALPFYSYATYPDGTLKTTPTEYAHLLIAMMNDGQYKGKSILRPETVAEMLTPVAKEGRQALSWNYDSLEELEVKELDNGHIIGHTGGDPGILTFALFNPQNRTGLVVFMNQGLEMNLKIINFGLLTRRLLSDAGLVP